MPMLSGVPGAPSPRKTSRISGSGFALSANRTRNGSPVPASAACSRRAFSAKRARS